jgi:hypothetical protein
MQLLRLIRSYFNRKFPVGMTEFHEWADRIIALSGNFADNDSMKFALASSLLHMDSKIAAKPDQYFVALMRKAAANQVASQFFQDIKAKQAAAQAIQTVEATTPPPVEAASNVEIPATAQN